MTDTILNLAPTFGGICIEDVRSPGSMAATNRLERALNIPIINNHREGVAIGLLAVGRLYSTLTGTGEGGFYTWGAMIYEFAVAIIAGVVLLRFGGAIVLRFVLPLIALGVGAYLLLRYGRTQSWW